MARLLSAPTMRLDLDDTTIQRANRPLHLTIKRRFVSKPDT